MKNTQDSITAEILKALDQFVYRHNRKPTVEKFGIVLEEQQELRSIFIQALQTQAEDLEVEHLEE